MVNALELNKELLIWVGFTFTNGVWTYPDGVTVDGDIPFFPADETACFKWLAPRLWICNITLVEAIFWNVGVSIPDYHGRGKHGDGKAVDEHLAMALCLAIKELKDGN